MNRIIGLMAICLLIGSQAFASGTRTFVKSDGGNLSADVNYAPSITGKAEIQSVTIHFDVAMSSDIYVQLDSELGAMYDTVLATSDSVTLNSFFWQPDSTLIIEKADNIRVHIDSSGTETYAVTIRGDYK